jgi:hypothetical protein
MNNGLVVSRASKRSRQILTRTAIGNPSRARARRERESASSRFITRAQSAQEVKGSSDSDTKHMQLQQISSVSRTEILPTARFCSHRSCQSRYLSQLCYVSWIISMPCMSTGAFAIGLHVDVSCRHCIQSNSVPLIVSDHV